MFAQLKPALLGLVLIAAALPAASAVKDFNEQSESIFVLRVHNVPGNVRLIVFDGKPDKGDAFRFSKFTPARFTGVLENGYLVGRSKHGEWLALSTVGGNQACENGSTLAFQVPPGKVGYVGDLVVRPEGHGFVASPPTQDMDAARQFMQQHYPQWKDRLEATQARLVKVDRKCPTGYERTVIPIQINI